MGWIRTRTKVIKGVVSEPHSLLVDSRCLLYAVAVPADMGPGCILYLTTGASLCVESTVDQVHALIDAEEKGY